jgi:hypothetical protein
MTLPVWGQQEKSLDDDQTIDEAIAEAIAEHEADPEAHLGAGESLEQHKTEDMIDHPAGSVASDKLPQARLLITAFESLDGWGDFLTGTGSINQDFGSVILNTGTTINSNSLISATPTSWSAFNTSKQMFWKCVLKLSDTTSQEARFGMGALGGGDGISGAGFEVENGTLYAYTEDDQDVDRVELAGITLTDWNVYEVRYDPSDGLFRFFVNGTQQISVDRTFTEPVDDTLAVFRIKNTTGANRALSVTDMVAQIDR